MVTLKSRLVVDGLDVLLEPDLALLEVLDRVAVLAADLDRQQRLLESI
jgi:hypothetical protein